MQFDFEDELRGEGDEETMNAKESGIIPAVIVGVIISAVQIWMARSSDRGDTTATSLATLTERVATLSTAVGKLTEQPYVRRDELATVSNRVDGLEQRVGVVERESVQRRN